MHKPFPKLNLLLAALLTFWISGSIAQNTADYETISTAQGLSQGMVFDMLQDNEGFMWIATKNGLNRYDGYTFKVFTNDPYNSNSLSSNTIIKIFEDRKGRIWIGTENAGLNIYNKKTGKFFRLAHLSHDAKTLSGNDIRLIAELTDGRILVSTVTSGLNIVELGDKFFDTGEKAQEFESGEAHSVYRKV